MIWNSKVETIVMVTHEVEKGRMKCHRYWPDPTSSPPVTSLNYGAVIVRHVRSTPHRHFVVREFTAELDGEVRAMRQFAYTSWPDHGVPLTTGELLGFRNAINCSITNHDVPILIHCSAGVGRTGTYIAIDRLVKQALDMGGELSVDSVVRDMRMRRNYMVQTEVGEWMDGRMRARVCVCVDACVCGWVCGWMDGGRERLLSLHNSVVLPLQVQYMFIYRSTLDAVRGLLADESKKVGVVPACVCACVRERERETRRVFTPHALPVAHQL